MFVVITPGLMGVPSFVRRGDVEYDPAAHPAASHTPRPIGIYQDSFVSINPLAQRPLDELLRRLNGRFSSAFSIVNTGHATGPRFHCVVRSGRK